MICSTFSSEFCGYAERHIRSGELLILVLELKPNYLGPGHCNAS